MTIHPEHPPSPGPSIALVAPLDGATASRTAPPTFSWTGSGASGYELHFSGTPYLEKLKALPRRGQPYTPTAIEWSRLVRLTANGDGVTLSWWAVAVDPAGARRSARVRSLGLTLP